MLYMITSTQISVLRRRPDSIQCGRRRSADALGAGHGRAASTKSPPSSRLHGWGPRRGVANQRLLEGPAHRSSDTDGAQA